MGSLNLPYERYGRFINLTYINLSDGKFNNLPYLSYGRFIILPYDKLYIYIYGRYNINFICYVVDLIIYHVFHLVN